MPAITTNMLSLPDEMLVEISKHLNMSGKHHLSLTCQRLENIINGSIKTLKSSVLSEGDGSLPAEVLRRYWNHDTRELNLSSMKVSWYVWRRILKARLNHRHVTMTDCKVSDGDIMPSGIDPKMIEFIRCTGSKNIYELLLGQISTIGRRGFLRWSDNKPSGFFVDRGLTYCQLAKIYICFLRRAIRCGFQKQHPLMLVLEDAERQVTKITSVDGENRHNTSWVEDKKLFDLYITQAFLVRGQRSRMVAVRMTYSQGGDQPDCFKVVVSSSVPLT